MQLQNPFFPPFHSSIPNIIFILIFIASSSTSFGQEEGQLFFNCQTLFSCGRSFPNISYPFWGGDRFPDCGLQGFRLTCLQDDHLTIDIAGQAFRVLSINEAYPLLRIARNDLWNDICPENYSQSINASFLFRPGQDTYNVPLFYDCAYADALPPRYRFSCNKNGNIRTEFSWENVDGVCGSNASVPVLARESLYQEFERNVSMSLQVLLYEGFNVEYDLDSPACSACEHSGGLCWLGTNSTRPTCLCYDGIHDLICNTTSDREVLRRGFALQWDGVNCSNCQRSRGRCGSYYTEFICVCGDHIHPKTCYGRRLKLGLKIGIGVSAAAGSAIVMCLIFYLYQYRQKKKHSRDIYTYPSSVADPEKSISSCGVRIFDYSELEKATDNFNSERELGDGGFGTVYKGKLQDGREVAVKRLYESNFKRFEQFKNEVEILTRLRHKNLVSLYGCTSRHCRELLLVYEYIPNGTVADHLHGPLARPGSLPWNTRINIAIETASALSYLHASDVIHRDVKTNNILLDNNFCVRVADFGLSRLFPLNATHISTAPQGTPGYVDPEYHECYHLTDKSDVFSFGVVLIELISSMPAVDITRHRHEIKLSNMATNKIQSDSLHELVDPNLGFESDYNVRMMITDVAELAFQCLQSRRDMRPSMQELLKVLSEIQNKDRGAGYAKEVNDKAENVQLPKTHKLTSSPDSVIEEWVSSTTTPTTTN